MDLMHLSSLSVIRGFLANTVTFTVRLINVQQHKIEKNDLMFSGLTAYFSRLVLVDRANQEAGLAYK